MKKDILLRMKMRGEMSFFAASGMHGALKKASPIEYLGIR